MPRTTVAGLVAATLAAAALSGCSGGEASSAPRPAPTSTFTAGQVPVIVPGAPGETPAVLQPGETGTMANAGAYRTADVTFMTKMVGHHAQALEMAELAPDRAEDQRVVRLAARIAAGQGPEIQAMQAWLAAQGLPPAKEHGGHHDDMPGMVSAQEMTRLVAARGSEFDRKFLTLMIRHHTGALRMANEAVGAQHPLVSEMVDDVVATQGAEINRMKRVLVDLPA